MGFAGKTANFSEINNSVSLINNNIASLEDIINQIDHAVDELASKLAGLAPITGSTTADWFDDESVVVTIGAANTRYKVHSLLISIHNLISTNLVVRLYTLVNGVERKIYEQVFSAIDDPPGLWIINGTLGIHDTLKVTLESWDDADNGKAVDYDCLLEAM